VRNALINFNKNSEHSSLFLFVCTLTVLVMLSACQPQEPKRQQLVYSGPIMGTEYRVSLVTDLQLGDLANSQKSKEIEKAIVGAMNLVNQSMSNYIVDSEISQFNRLGANIEQTLSTDFHNVMLEAQAIAKMSDGAFDVTLGNAIDAWGFGPDGKITKQPTDGDLTKFKLSSGYQKIKLKNNKMSKLVNGLELSLSAIAKGYAVDKVAAALTGLGLDNFLINIGGELRASGVTIDGNVWRVGVEKPHVLGGIQEIVLLKDAAIATSGDYRNFLIVENQQFSHMIDPKSLKPVLHKLALVSVVSERASTADALATAMMAMGEEAAWQFAQDQQVAAYLIVRGDVEGDFQIQTTEKFKAYLQ